MRIVVGGTFDIIHVGHIRFLWAAKKLAENSELIVIVARDETVKKIKGREPIFSEEERLEIVSNLKPVDKAVLGYKIGERSFFDILLELKPDIVALGYDQKINENDIREWAKRNDLNIKVIRLPKFECEISSSTMVREKIFNKLDEKLNHFAH